MILVNKESKSNLKRQTENSEGESNNSRRKNSDPNLNSWMPSPINHFDKRPRIFTDDYHSPTLFKC